MGNVDIEMIWEGIKQKKQNVNLNYKLMNGANRESTCTPTTSRPQAFSSQLHRIDMQKNQLKVILNDFKKAKNKCETLFYELSEQFVNKDQFDKMQKTAAIKTQLLDLQGIVSLKNQLIRALTQLYDIEHQLAFKKERNQFFYNSPQIPKTKKLPQFPPQVEKFTLEVPTYNCRQQQNFSKIQRLSSYLYDLRKNMRRLSTAIFKNYQTTDFLMNQPEYLQLKEKVERYKMRSEQLSSILQKKISEQVKMFISSCECLEENDEFKVIKVYDSDVRDLGRWYELTQIDEWNDDMSRGRRSFGDVRPKGRGRAQSSHTGGEKDIKCLRLLRSNPRKEEIQLQKQGEQDPHSTSVSKGFKDSILSKFSCEMIKEGENRNNNSEMANKAGVQGKKHSQRIECLTSLGGRRKKVFTDDLWQEFEKI